MLAYVDVLVDKYIPSQLIMISHDRLAQYWEVCSHNSKGIISLQGLMVNQAFGHVSFCVFHPVTDLELR